jgi:hypothetical protein
MMAFVHAGDGALDYFPCHYGSSKLTFRGPRRDLSGEYLAMLGGTETYGRFVIAPFPALVEEHLGVPVANLACQNAGPDVYLADRATLDVAAEAHLAVVQLGGAQNMTNRYYTVHPRRNDRFIAATPLLRSIYRDVDFTEIHFTRHLMLVLAAKGAERFAPIAAELKGLWVQRMKAVLQRLPQRRVLLWTADHLPPEPGQGDGLDRPPFLIDSQMIAALLPHASAYVEHVSSAAALAEGVQSMRFSPTEEAVAQGLPGGAVHQEAAQALIPVVDRLL